MSGQASERVATAAGPPPGSLNVRWHGNTLEVRWRRMSYLAVIPALVFIASGFLTFQILKHGALDVLLDPASIIVAAVAAASLVATVQATVNQAVLSVDPMFIKLHHRPVPFTGSHRIAVRAVDRVFLDKRTVQESSGTRDVFDVIVRDQLNDHHLVENIPDPAMAAWLARAVEAHVGRETTP
jgi:hypothetical protein